MCADFSHQSQPEGKRFLLEGIQQAYWVGQEGALELSVPATYYVEAEVPAAIAAGLDRALQLVIARHDMLRAVLLAGGEQQVLAEVPRHRVPVEDMSVLAPGARHERLQALRAEMKSRDFAPGVWPQFDIRATAAGDVLRLHMRFALWMMDGWSFHVLLRELVRLSADPDAGLPPIEMSFAEYVSARRQMRQGPRWQKAWDYWQPRLADFPGPPSLPLTRNLAPGQRPAFRHRSTRLSASRWAAIVASCARRRITPSLLACSAYAEVLARYSGSSQFAITVLHSGRFAHLPRSACVFGNFGTTILLEVDASRAKPFIERTRLLQRQFWRDAERLEVSGIDVSRALQQRAGAVSGVSVPVTFTAVTSGTGDKDDAASQARIDYDTAGLEVPQVHLDHQLHLCDDGTAVFNWDHVEGLFPKGFVDAVCDAHLALMSGLAENEALWDRIDPDPRARPAPEPAALPAAAPQRLEALFDAQALAHPDSVAVLGCDRAMSYGALRLRARALAAELRRRGARRNQLVAVSMRKGWEQVAAVLGVLYAGAAYVPIDPDLPEERRNLLLASSEAGIVLTTPSLATSLAWPAGADLLVVDGTADARREAEPAAEGTAADLAYVIFTSGSTGSPKGVMIDHRGAWNTIADLNERFGVGPGDRLLALSSLSFDLSVYDIFGALAAGATIVMPDADRARDASHWRELVNRHGVTIWNSVPALMQLALEGARGAALPTLRLVMLSGDWIPLNLPDRIRPAAPQAQIYSLGGATEASIWSNLFPVGPVDPEWRSIPYGHAMRHQSIHVLDRDLAVCEPWVPGDIFIGGAGVALGYWRDAGKTAASFISHPVTGERLYRTGDLGRYLGDGEIEFLGRKDFQVKIQGFRVECAEVEAAILAGSDIKAAVVSAAADAAGTRHLVAHVVAQDALPAVETSALRKRLLAILPPYMVPTFFVVLPKLPLSDNGKVVRSALPKPDFGARRAQARADHAPPAEGIERTVAELWQDVLGASDVGRDDNFFALGGSSFAGMRLTAKLEERFRRRISFAALASHPTVAGIAAVLRGETAEEEASSLTLLRPGTGAPPLFCVHPIGGNVTCYVPLALGLEPGRPVYGLRAPGLTPSSGAPLSSIPAMAERYVEEIRSVQPSGPYHLLGWSLGGLIVQELARRLRGDGQQVGLLAMIDSAVPRRSDEGPKERFEHFAADLSAIAGVALPLAEADPAVLPTDRRIAWLTEKLARSGIAADLATMETVFRVFEAGSEALATHAPAPFPGEADLFLALDRPDAAEVARAWRRLMPRIRITELAADHYAIMRPPATDAIAAAVDAVMRERDRGNGRSLDAHQPREHAPAHAGPAFG